MDQGKLPPVMELECTLRVHSVAAGPGPGRLRLGVAGGYSAPAAVCPSSSVDPEAADGPGAHTGPTVPAI